MDRKEDAVLYETLQRGSGARVHNLFHCSPVLAVLALDKSHVILKFCVGGDENLVSCRSGVHGW